ncbi:MAG TPA: hypothetical protein VKR61_24880, partial [Bryobacteraceae bacterium]|nr:hypothetical protein [Bryobacteraceae bacterium]
MECLLRLFSGRRCASALVAVSAVLALFPSGMRAQAPPVPVDFQDLYTQLNTYLVNFNATLNVDSGSRYAGLPAVDLKAANANAGPQLINTAGYGAVKLQVQAIKAMGAKAVVLELGFPMLYEPFLTSQGQSYAQ